MRHEDYKKAPIPNIYVQIARWCNQPGFYRNLSFWQFCYKNQTYWEEHTLGIKHERLKTYEEFLEDYKNGYYNEVKMATPLKTIFDFLNKFKHHQKAFLSFFNLSFKQMKDPKLWYRDTKIMLRGKEYIMNEEYWNNLLGNSDNELALLKAYYTHTDDDIITNQTKCELLLKVLKNHTCTEIINLIKEEDLLFKIEKKDIPQFSDFKDAYFKVPFLLAHCGEEDVDYNQMGYMLRSGSRKEVADRKYGENHIKTAAQMGLCNFVRCKANTSTLGNLFIKLTDEERKKLLPKICLYIPFIHNYFKKGGTNEVREEMLSILSVTTQNRRRSNVNTIIETIKKAL